MPKIEMRIHSDRLYVTNFSELPESMQTIVYNAFNTYAFELFINDNNWLMVDYEKSGLWQVLSDLTCDYEILIY